MLARYQIVRGKKSVLPEGAARRDIRAHRNSILSPTRDMVKRVLEDSSGAVWRSFRAEYDDILSRRFVTRREEFDALVEVARNESLYLGCNCPTTKNPDVNRCHTVLALRFLKKKYPDLEVEFP